MPTNITQANQLTPAYTQLIPISELSEGQAASIRNAVIQKLVSLANAQLAISPDKLVVRDIRALSDLDYTYEDWNEATGGTANAYETMSTGTMGDQRWVGIYGVMIATLVDEGLPCTALKFNIGGADRYIWQLQSLKPLDNRVGFCPSAVIIPQNTPYTISRYVRSINSTFLCVLRGVVVEPRGLVISP